VPGVFTSRSPNVREFQLYHFDATLNDPVQNTRQLIQNMLGEILDSSGRAAVDRFNTLRDVDRKVDEFSMLLDTLPPSAQALKQAVAKDENFQMNSRRIRLETLAHHCRVALKFVDSGIIQPKKQIFKGPVLTKLTGGMPKLEAIIRERWIDAQKCQHVGAYLASIILMGSILEALLLGKAISFAADAQRSSRAPKRKDGSQIPIPDWNLNALIDVAVDCSWLKVDRGKFGHALRESRNVVHPWQHASINADFDEATCKTCWQVLNAAVEDLLL
jgi:hypothetical protein